MTAHARGAAGIKATVRAGVHPIVHGTYIDGRLLGQDSLDAMLDRARGDRKN